MAIFERGHNRTEKTTTEWERSNDFWLATMEKLSGLCQGFRGWKFTNLHLHSKQMKYKCDDSC